MIGEGKDKQQPLCAVVNTAAGTTNKKVSYTSPAAQDQVWPELQEWQLQKKCRQVTEEVQTGSRDGKARSPGLQSPRVQARAHSVAQDQLHH